MAIVNGYLTIDEAVSYIGRNETRDTAELEDVVTSVSRMIDDFCGRVFYQTTEARYFDTVDMRTVVFGPFNDLVSATSIKYDIDGDGVYETTVPSTSYQLLDINLKPVKFHPEGRPYGSFRLLTQSASLPLFVPSGRLNLVEVTGTWGWPGTGAPIAIKQAARLMVAEVAKLQDAPLGVAGMGEYGVMRVSRYMPARAVQLLQPFRHPQNVGLA
jgi:hypothetical protein